MSVTPTKTVGKVRAVNSSNAGSPSASNRAAIGDDIIPLLLAVNPGIVLNYRQMAALDPRHRTYSSWEHKFRKWKARAKEIAEGAAKANGESSKAAGDMEDNTTAEPAVALKRKTTSRLESQASNDGDDAPIKKSKKAPAKVKQAAPINAINDDNASDKQALPIRPTTARKEPTNVPTVGQESSAKNGEVLDIDGEDAAAKTNTSKKRDEATQDVINESPTKKVRANKKGTARVVKKNPKKPTETEEEISEDEDIENEDIVKPKAKARAEKKGTVRAMKKKAKQPFETSEKISEDDESDCKEIAKPNAKGGKASDAAKPVTRSKGKAEKAVEKEDELVETQGEVVGLQEMKYDEDQC
ncbi:hypothetical protein MMC29_004868 [Sticta canariensis]|nr:hypothetical protein [Sticta canariensis]